MISVLLGDLLQNEIILPIILPTSIILPTNNTVWQKSNTSSTVALYDYSLDHF